MEKRVWKIAPSNFCLSAPKRTFDARKSVQCVVRGEECSIVCNCTVHLFDEENLTRDLMPNGHVMAYLGQMHSRF